MDEATKKAIEKHTIRLKQEGCCVLCYRVNDRQGAYCSACLVKGQDKGELLRKKRIDTKQNINKWISEIGKNKQ